MFKKSSLYVYSLLFTLILDVCLVTSGDAPADTLSTTNRYNSPDTQHAAQLDKLHQQQKQHQQQQHQLQHQQQQLQQQQHQHHQQQQQQQQLQQQHQHAAAVQAGQHGIVGAGTGGSNTPVPPAYHGSAAIGSGHIEKRNSYNLLSEAMSQAVSNEFSSLGSGSADGACHADDLDCYANSVQDRLGMEAIATLHRQLDDDDNGNIDLSESDDFLREELKYDSGYEKRQKAFHFNDDMHISVKELWEAWLRSEVHNWTMEQTTDWLAQSVQLPQYVELFKIHKVTGAALPRLAVNNMHYVGNVLGIKDPIHKQKIALKAMDVVLFGPPRETGTRWKDYILVTLLLSAIIGCWYAYQQNKNAKRHLRRMAQDMEGLQRAEQSLQEMQKELERARMEQESVETEKMDLERRLKEAPMLTSSNSDLEVQQLKKEIEILRNELSRAEIELVDNCWTPPPQLQSWLQYTYELESKNHLKKRVSAEKQLQSAREACEKLRKKRSSLVGAFVSTHGKSIDDVDRSIVEARNSLGEVTNELQERLHRWKQIETCLGFNVVNNNGLPYLESILYGRNGGGGGSSIQSKSCRGRVTSNTDDLDDESVQGMFDSYSRNSLLSSSATVTYRDDSSSDEGATDATSHVHFYLGNAPAQQQVVVSSYPDRSLRSAHLTPCQEIVANSAVNHVSGSGSGNGGQLTPNVPAITTSAAPLTPLHHNNAQYPNYALNDSQHSISTTQNDSRHSPSVSSESSIAVPPRAKKQNLSSEVGSGTGSVSVPGATQSGPIGRAPLPPPRKAYQSQLLRSQSTDLVPLEIPSYLARQQQQLFVGNGNATPAATGGSAGKKMVKQHSTASQQSTSSTSSSVHSAPPVAVSDTNNGNAGQLPGRWSSPERIIAHGGQSSSSSAVAAATIRSSYSGDKETTIQKPTFGVLGNIVVRPQMPNSYSLQSLYNKSAASSTTVTASHSHTELEDRQKKSPVSSSPAPDTVSLSDFGGDGSGKKRRRRLRFPFGSSKKFSSSANHESSSKAKPS